MNNIMKNIFFLLIFFASKISGQTNNLTNTDSSNASNSFRILIINAFDVTITDHRKNKKALVSELADSLKSYLKYNITTHTGYEVLMIPENFSADKNRDSRVALFMDSLDASKAVLINSLNVYFENAGESVERGADGKNEKTIRYDLCSEIEYAIFTKQAVKDETVIKDCEFLADRKSTGTFSLQFGPDIVGKKKYTYKSVKRNAEKFVLEKIK